jgi:hypothetical protein
MIALLITILVILLVAYVAHYVIVTFLPADLQRIALIVTGIILLIVVVSLVAGRADLPALRW